MPSFAAHLNTGKCRYKVIFCRDQTDLDDKGHEAFAARLGEPAVHAILPTRDGTRTILELDSKAGAYASSWHTDLTYLECPPAISLLRGLVVPEIGSDTIRVVTSYNKATAAAAGPYIKNLYEAEQPLVRVHPETDERSLLLGRYAVLIVDLRPEDTKYLLDMFQDYASG